MKSKSKWMLLAAMAALVVGTLFVPSAFAADKVLYSAIDPVASFNTTSGGHGLESATLKNTVIGGANIQFNLSLKIDVGGGQGYPQTVTFGVTGTTGPSAPTVYFEGNTTKNSHVFSASSSSATDTFQVNIIAPADDGAYTVTIAAIEKGGAGGNPRLNTGSITIGFTVSNPTGCTKASTSLSLELNPACVIYKATETTFTATLTSEGNPVAGQSIAFKIGDTDLGTAVTDADGKASIKYDPSGLAVGTYVVVASFQGAECYLEAEPAAANLGVRYDFLGFQPPVKIDGVGAGLFSGKVIPVKIKIADAMGAPVPDAIVYLTWSATIAGVTYEDVALESVSAADTGNQMRYDPLADQYIYNWDTSKLDNGSYTLNVDMGEGCGGARTTTVILQKSTGKKK